jgi:hypothetical protein
MAKTPKRPDPCPNIRARRHATQDAALRVRWAMGQKGLDVSTLTVFRCRYCDGFHLARKPNSSR